MEPPPYSSCVREQSVFTIDPLPPPKNLSAPPPSYESLFGKIKSARVDSNSNLDLCRKVAEILSQTVGCLIFVGAFAALPIAQIIIGAQHFNECPLNDKIPIFLVVFGAAILVRFICLLMNYIQGIQKKREQNRNIENSDHSSSKKPNFFEHLLNMFIFIWFIMGNIWVFGVINISKSDRASMNYCSPTVYYFAFWSIVGVYILSGLLCLCLVCVGASVSYFSDNSENDAS